MPTKSQHEGPGPGPPTYSLDNNQEAQKGHPGNAPQQGYSQQPGLQGQAYSPYQPQQQGYAQQLAPQANNAYSPYSQAQPSQLSAQQVGEQYRAQLYAQCAQGIHQPTTKYGMCGIITAILCFPIGLICLFTDTEQKCDRCGIKLS